MNLLPFVIEAQCYEFLKLLARIEIGLPPSCKLWLLLQSFLHLLALARINLVLELLIPKPLSFVSYGSPTTLKQSILVPSLGWLLESTLLQHSLLSCSSVLEIIRLFIQKSFIQVMAGSFKKFPKFPFAK